MKPWVRAVTYIHKKQQLQEIKVFPEYQTQNYFYWAGFPPFGRLDHIYLWWSTKKREDTIGP